MGILDKALEPLKDYICFKDFIMQLSDFHNEPLYNVATFLLNINFSKNIDLYIIDVAYRITRVNSYKNTEVLNAYLDKLQGQFIFDNFIFTQKNYNALQAGDNRKTCLMEVFANSNLNLPTFHLYFNRQNLVDFEPLQSVVSDFLKVEPTPKEYPLFYKNDYFDLSECESMITGYDPSDNWQCSERQQAYSLVLSSVHNGLFEPHPHRENDYLISAENFRAWLKSKDIFIDGFTNTPNNINTQPDSQLLQQIADLNAQLASAGDTIKRQAKEIADLKAQLEQQPNQPSDTATDDDLLTKILDENNKNHAIDLKYAINLWVDLYVINPRTHGEHSGNADTWLKNNTGYSELKGGEGSIKRIREIATPLKKFGSTRPKENQK